MKTVLLAVAALATGYAAEAAPISNNMSCSQARSYVASYGKIYTRANGSDVIPIYASPSPYCGANETAFAISVDTRDGRCMVGYQCYYTGGSH